MQQAGKLIIAVLLLVIVAGCASRRRSASSEAGATNELNYEAELQRVVENNFVAGGFVIHKGSIELKGTAVEGVFGFNAKINSQGDAILSVRGPFGIEVVRLLAVGNEICMIERIGKIVYVGQRSEVMKRYGLKEDFFKSVFGDLDLDGLDSIASDAEGRIILFYMEEKQQRIVAISREEGKVCREEISTTEPDASIDLVFATFGDSGGLKYPGEIYLEDRKRQINVIITIENVTMGYTDPIEFIFPPYRRIAL